MSYSYQAPLTYGPQTNNLSYYDTSYQKPSIAPLVTGCTILGGGIGATTGAITSNKKNKPFGKNGEVTDSFAKSTYENFVEKTANSGKESYKGGLNILEKIDSVKSADELKTLFDNNKEATSDICTELKQTPDEFIQNIKKENLEANKKVIKEKINAGNKTRYQNMKNQIEACWNKDQKKFIKVDSVKDDVFNAIEKSKGGIKWGTVAKYGAIGAVVAGVLSFIAGKFMTK